MKKITSQKKKTNEILRSLRGMVVLQVRSMMKSKLLHVKLRKSTPKELTTSIVRGFKKSMKKAGLDQNFLRIVTSYSISESIAHQVML